MQTIQEAGSEAENTLGISSKKDTAPSNNQDLPRESSESEDRDDMNEESSTEVSSLNSDQGIDQNTRNNFTFMGNDPETNVLFEQISKFTSVEQYREFLEKELGEEKLLKAYPILKQFVRLII